MKGLHHILESVNLWGAKDQAPCRGAEKTFDYASIVSVTESNHGKQLWNFHSEITTETLFNIDIGRSIHVFTNLLQNLY